MLVVMGFIVFFLAVMGKIYWDNTSGKAVIKQESTTPMRSVEIKN